MGISSITISFSRMIQVMSGQSSLCSLLDKTLSKACAAKFVPLSMGFEKNSRVSWPCAHTQHANDAATTSLPGLGRIFSHAQQGNAEGFAPEIPESGARAQNRHRDRERSHTLRR